MANGINIGTNNISGIKIGTADVTSVYIGTELVYTAHKYDEQYLTFVAEENGTFSFSKSGMSYSINDGETWTELEASGNTPTVSSGSSIIWKSTISPLSSGIGTFSSTGKFDVEGNAMSLLFGDNFSGQTSLSGKNDIFISLFMFCSGLTNAENLVLPATTLAKNCYSYMFIGCTSLTTAPSTLPATTLANNCYGSMFNGCTSLTTAPELPATTLVDNCYWFMFNGCTSLSAITCLATDISATDCTTGWVNGVASTGTFTKNATMSGWTTGDNGIPSGWTVEDYPAEYRTTSGTPYCTGSTGTDKYVDVYSQASYDAGQSWVTTATTPTLVEEKCADCGFASRNVSGTPYCDGGAKVVDVDYEESYDSGSTYTTISSSTETVEACSQDCGCAGCVYNFCGVNTGGTTITIDNGTSLLKSTDLEGYDIAEGEVGDATQTISGYCFEGNQISSLTLSDSVTTIEHEAFQDCNRITALTIPSGVTEIGFWTFARMTACQEVIFERDTVFSIGGMSMPVFHDWYPPVVYVPDAAVTDYRSMGIEWWIDGVSTYPNINDWIQPISNRP